MGLRIVKKVDLLVDTTGYVNQYGVASNNIGVYSHILVSQDLVVLKKRYVAYYEKRTTGKWLTRNSTYDAVAQLQELKVGDVVPKELLA